MPWTMVYSEVYELSCFYNMQKHYGLCYKWLDEIHFMQILKTAYQSL